MKYILFFMLIPFFSKTSCNSKQAGVPSCVQQQIEKIRAESKWNPPAEVNEYTYNGKQVYLFSSPCCDQYNMLYDENCNILCAPTGGFTGRGDEKCSDFSTTAKHIRLVWKDDR